MGGRARVGAGTVSRGRVSRLAAAGIGPLASVGFWVSVGVSASVGIFGTVAPARAEAPITSPQDAACRNEARAKVFVAPDPHGIGLYAVGRQIYMACMARAKPRVAKPRFAKPRFTKPRVASRRRR